MESYDATIRVRLQADHASAAREEIEIKLAAMFDQWAVEAIGQTTGTVELEGVIGHIDGSATGVLVGPVLEHLETVAASTELYQREHLGRIHGLHGEAAAMRTAHFTQAHVDRHSAEPSLNRCHAGIDVLIPEEA
jgi:hypothetical protein